MRSTIAYRNPSRFTVGAYKSSDLRYKETWSSSTAHILANRNSAQNIVQSSEVWPMSCSANSTKSLISEGWSACTLETEFILKDLPSILMPSSGAARIVVHMSEIHIVWTPSGLQVRASVLRASIPPISSSDVDWSGDIPSRSLRLKNDLTLFIIQFPRVRGVLDALQSSVEIVSASRNYVLIASALLTDKSLYKSEPNTACIYYDAVTLSVIHQETSDKIFERIRGRTRYCISGSNSSTSHQEWDFEYIWSDVWTVEFYL